MGHDLRGSERGASIVDRVPRGQNPEVRSSVPDRREMDPRVSLSELDPRDPARRVRVSVPGLRSLETEIDGSN